MGSHDHVHRGPGGNLSQPKKHSFLFSPLFIKLFSYYLVVLVGGRLSTPYLVTADNLYYASSLGTSSL